MRFSLLSSYLDKLERIASRNQMTAILAKLFQQAKNQEIDKICYLCLGRLAPKYEGIEFNMGEKLIVRALAIMAKKTSVEINKAYKDIGDLGAVAFKFKNTSKNSKLSVLAVYTRLRKIAEDSGEGSVNRKVNRIAELLTELSPLSAKYIARIPVNKLRLGFSDMTILDALSWWKTGDKSLRPELERAFNVLTDIGKISRTFKEKGIKGIRTIKSEIGVPIRAAKAERLSKPREILAKMAGKCALEPKYDGFRVEIHFDKSQQHSVDNYSNLSLFDKKKQLGMVRIFSRNLDNITLMFPEIIEAAQKFKVQSAIFDGEAIAYNPQTGKLLDFQETVQRKRKYGIDKKAQEMPLRVFIFDLLYLNGKNLLTQPLSQRRKLLEQVFRQSQIDKSKFILTPQKIVTKIVDFNLFFQKAEDEGLEGLMAKKLDGVYQAGARNYNWVKYKVAMQSELADTIDCVVMGYYRGKGKRTVFGIGAFLVGIYHQSQFLTVSKIGTGLTDKQWQDIFKRLKKLEVKNKPKEYKVNKNLNPDVWCRPELVVEIEADTITKSPIHTAGLALRFPRLKRIRKDKNSQQATNLEELRKLAKYSP